jgi:hypothetical protein
MARSGSKGLVLTAMIFAVAMTFIDQTIVSIAVPDIQRELSLSSTGIQWAVNAYLLALGRRDGRGRGGCPGRSRTRRPDGSRPGRAYGRRLGEVLVKGNNHEPARATSG